MARKVTIRRGLKADLPLLDIGELGYAIDTEELFIGSESGNVLFAKKNELDSLQEQITIISQSDVFTRLGVSANGLLTIDGIEQTVSSGGGEEMTLVVKDYFEGSTNITKTYTDNMIGFAISNDAGVSGGTLTFTINGITIPVKATESYESNFSPFKTVSINTTVPYRATVSMPYGGTFDTIAPLNISGLTTSNITTSDLTLSWVASSSSDVSGYEIYQGSNLLATITETTYSVGGLNPSTSYTFTIKAKDNSGNISSGISVTVSTLADTTAPNNVTNLVASNILATSLALSWTASTSSDTTGYEVYNGSTLLTTVTGTTYNVTGLTSNTNYTFTVKAKDGFNNIATGASISVTTANVDTTAPFDVTGLAAGTPTVNSIPVGWTLSSSSDVANYEVAYSSNGGSTWTVASSVINNSSTSYTITGLSSGTTYTIRVIAIDTSGNRSTGVTVTKATASSASYTVSASPSSGTYNSTQNVTLSVTPSGATIYYTTNGTTPTTSSSVYSSPIVVSANTTIKFLAQDGSGNATSIQTATYTIDTVAPTVTISPVAGSYNSTQSVAISANETSNIYYTIDGTTPTTSSSVYSAPISVSDTKTIKYLVVDTAGNQTTGSATYTIDTTSSDPITNLVVGTVTSNSIPVSWTAPSAPDVSKYEIAYSSNGGTTYTLATSSLSAPAINYTVTGLSASTSYTIRVVTIDAAGNRSTPVTINATTTATLATVYPENGYLVMPVNQFIWTGAASGYTDTDYIGMALQDNVLSPIFDQSTASGDPIISTTYPFKPFITNMPTANYPYECSTIGTSGSYLGKMILKVSKTKGATATDLVTYLANSNEQMKVKLVSGYKTYTISSNVSGVTTRTSGVDTVNYEYFKCTLSDGIGDYVPSTILDKFVASNGYEIIASSGYVFSYGKKAMRINADSTLEMLLPKGTLASIDQAGVSSFLASANIKIYYI